MDSKKLFLFVFLVFTPNITKVYSAIEDKRSFEYLGDTSEYNGHENNDIGTTDSDVLSITGNLPYSYQNLILARIVKIFLKKVPLYWWNTNFIFLYKKVEYYDNKIPFENEKHNNDTPDEDEDETTVETLDED